MNGCMIISLDYELMWGCHDWATVDGYGETNISNVPEVISRTLLLFEKYNVHATFATVGMIMADNKNQLMEYMPSKKPTYLDKTKSTYDHVDYSIIDGPYRLLFLQPSLVSEINKRKGMEVGTHTFCHYFCWEPGQTAVQFEQDLLQAKAIATEKGIDLKSIVFPKNNVSDEYLKICKLQGISSYRGNAKKFFSKPKSKIGRYYNKIMRMLDCYLNIGGYSGYNFCDILQNPEHPINIPASRMLRPYIPFLAFLEPIRMKRIRAEIKHAACHHEVYHLWWHPHNFGANMEQNFKNLESILKCYSLCHQQYGMVSYNMNDLVKEVSK